MDKIQSITGKEILDSRQNVTVEVEIVLSGGIIARASVPHGKSTGSREKKYVSVQEAISHIEGEIFQALRGVSVLQQKEIDKILLELDGTNTRERLGVNSLLPVSFACARAAAQVEEKPLWKYISSILQYAPNYNPMLLVNVINGGEHGNSNLDIQEHLFVISGESAANAQDISEKLFIALKNDITQKYQNEVQFGDEGGIVLDFSDPIAPLLQMKEIVEKESLVEKVSFGIDAAANNINKSDEELFDLYMDLKEHIGNLSYIEDPFKENNKESFKKLKDSIGHTTIICGDDLTTTDKETIEACGKEGVINGVIIKPNQIGTLSETVDAIQAAKDNAMQHIVSHRSGETADDFIADLAVGTGAYGFKLGTYKQSERIAKYTRLLEIEREREV